MKEQTKVKIVSALILLPVFAVFTLYIVLGILSFIYD